MTKTHKPEDVTDADLDAATGGTDRNHKQWIPVLSVDQGINRAKGDPVPVEDFSLNYEEIKWT